MESAYGGAFAALAALGGEAAVCNHRFQLRRRESEARVFLALMKLLDEKGAGAGQFIEYPAGAGSAWDDYATIRRHLIEYRFLDRKPDGSEYWRR